MRAGEAHRGRLHHPQTLLGHTGDPDSDSLWTLIPGRKGSDGDGGDSGFLPSVSSHTPRPLGIGQPWILEGGTWGHCASAFVSALWGVPASADNGFLDLAYMIWALSSLNFRSFRTTRKTV